MIYTCSCSSAKKFRLTYDGGSSGTYQLELCDACHNEKPTKFLIAEELNK